MAEIVALGRRAVAIQLDTGNVGAFDVFVDRVRRAHSAGWDRAFRLSHKQCRYRPPQRIEKTTEAELDALYNVHFKGVFFLTQKLLPLINDGGRIVNISFGSPASSCLTAPLMVR